MPTVRTVKELCDSQHGVPNTTLLQKKGTRYLREAVSLKTRQRTYGPAAMYELPYLNIGFYSFTAEK